MNTKFIKNLSVKKKKKETEITEDKTMKIIILWELIFEHSKFELWSSWNTIAYIENYKHTRLQGKKKSKYILFHIL